MATNSGSAAQTARSSLRNKSNIDPRFQPVATAEAAGITNAIQGGNTAQVVGGTGGAAAPQPQMGVTGVTPGAVERRLSSGTPTNALGGAVTPGAIARFSNPSLFQNNPNQLGPARKAISAPVGNIQQFLQNLQARNQVGR